MNKTTQLAQLPEQVAVVNAGLEVFATSIAEQDRSAINMDWRISSKLGTRGTLTRTTAGAFNTPSGARL